MTSLWRDLIPTLAASGVMTFLGACSLSEETEADASPAMDAALDAAGDSGADTSVPDAGGDSDAGETSPLREFCEQLADAICSAAGACCDPGEEGPCREEWEVVCFGPSGIAGPLAPFTVKSASRMVALETALPDGYASRDPYLLHATVGRSTVPAFALRAGTDRSFVEADLDASGQQSVAYLEMEERAPFGAILRSIEELAGDRERVLPVLFPRGIPGDPTRPMPPALDPSRGILGILRRATGSWNTEASSPDGRSPAVGDDPEEPLTPRGAAGPAGANPRRGRAGARGRRR
jgi:hypothetical protein